MIALAPPPIVAENHPAYVRVIVGVRATSQQVEATDPLPDDDGRVELRVTGAPLEPVTQTVRGIRVAIDTGTIRLSATGYKYMRQTATGSRVIVDLYKARPTVSVRRGRNGCLELTSIRRSGRVFVLRGRERRLFEHSFFVVLRGPTGKVLRTRAMTGDRWTLRLPTRGPSGSTGTIEAAATSARDGSLVCLVQARVTL